MGMNRRTWDCGLGHKHSLIEHAAACVVVQAAKMFISSADEVNGQNDDFKALVRMVDQWQAIYEGTHDEEHLETLE